MEKQFVKNDSVGKSTVPLIVCTDWYYVKSYKLLLVQLFLIDTIVTHPDKKLEQKWWILEQKRIFEWFLGKRISKLTKLSLKLLIFDPTT